MYRSTQKVTIIEISTTHFIPHDRKDVNCFGDDTCYSLAFGVPAVALLIGTIFFATGTKLYVKQPPKGSIIVKVVCSMLVILIVVQCTKS